jgi:hypothetical protein
MLAGGSLVRLSLYWTVYGEGELTSANKWGIDGQRDDCLGSRACGEQAARPDFREERPVASAVTTIKPFLRPFTERFRACSHKISRIRFESLGH